MATPPKHKISDAVVKSVADDFRTGLYGRNEVAERNGISRATATRIAKEHNLDPSAKSTATQHATRAVAVETKARREKLKLELLGDIERLRIRAWSPWTKEVVTREGIEALTAELPPLPEVLAAYKSIGVALDGIYKLEALNTAGGETVQDARDFLMDFRNQLAGVRDEFEANTGVDFDSEEARTIIAGEVVDSEDEEPSP